MDLYNHILFLLSESEIAFETLQHDPALTIEQVSSVLNYPLEQSTKTLALEGTSRMVVATVAAHERFNFKAIATVVGVKRLSMCKEQTLTENFGVERGGVAPFGFPPQIVLVVSASLFTAPHVYFSPGRRDLTLKLASDDFKRVMSDALVV